MMSDENHSFFMLLLFHSLPQGYYIPIFICFFDDYYSSNVVVLPCVETRVCVFVVVPIVLNSVILEGYGSTYLHHLRVAGI